MMRVSLSGRVVSLVVVLGCFSLTGCLGNRDWQYPPSSTGVYLNSKAAKSISAKVLVLPLEDLRGNAKKDEYWKAAIPLMPYGERLYERPETAENPEEVDVIRFDPPNDFAKAIAAELNQAGVFSSVKFAQDEKQETTDLVLRGSIRATDWERRLTTWGFGPVGPVFWFLGAPMSWTNTTLKMDLNLTPANNPKKILWRQKMIAEGHWTDGIYYNLEEPAKLFPESLQEALREAVEDLVNIANQNPQQLMPQ
jgi:hypothetical protein